MKDKLFKAYQRATKGYDYTAYWCFDYYIIETFLPVIKFFRDETIRCHNKGSDSLCFHNKEMVDEMNFIVDTWEDVLNGGSKESDLQKANELFGKNLTGMWT